MHIGLRSRLFACAIAALGIVAISGCGGDDDDDADNSVDTDATAGTTTEATSNGASGDSGGSGTAAVDITGIETFTFDITCSFGTGIIEGPGKRNDGEPAYLRGGFDVTESGEPREDAEAVDFIVKVGIAELFGAGDYEWVVGPEPQDIANDGESASFAAGFEYRANTSETRFPYGEVKGGRFEATCP